MKLRISKTPENFLLLMAFIMPFTFSVWQVLLNNYVVEVASFSGKEIGMLQSIREVPGFLSFLAVFLLAYFKEQKLALFFLAFMCIGVALMGYSTTAGMLYLVTFIMSVGFHYFETINQSLTLQWIEKSETPVFMGRVLSLKGVASILSYSAVWFFMSYFEFSYKTVFLIAGVTGLFLVLFNTAFFPIFSEKEGQRKKMVLRKKYWLYYLLTFFSGARRQIFMVFAGFMMVQKFGYSVKDISILFIINYALNIFFAPKIGRLVKRVGEKKVLRIEYIGLIIIFISYGLVENKWIAALLYILDHLFFAMAMALKTYFQKIADPKDIASTAGVSFTINHIAAVFIPAVLGILWIHSPLSVFLFGAFIAACSLFFTRYMSIEEQVK